mgnify:FL=1
MFESSELAYRRYHERAREPSGMRYGQFRSRYFERAEEDYVDVKEAVAVGAVGIAVAVAIWRDRGLDPFQAFKESRRRQGGIYFNAYVKEGVRGIEAPRVAPYERGAARGRVPFVKGENSGDSPLQDGAAVADIRA